MNYELIKNGKWGKLKEDKTYHTPITSYRASLDLKTFQCELFLDGRLVIRKGSEWDFGSWAIDTPAMVEASLAHDAICHLTNYRKIPWECRKVGDAYFRRLLQDNGGVVSPWWRWAGVSMYSQLVARWKDKK